MRSSSGPSFIHGRCVTVTAIFPVVVTVVVRFIGTGMVMLQYITVMVIVTVTVVVNGHTHANAHSINACRSYSFSLVLTLENAVCILEEMF
jgi:hypothetical protein